ncbi:MAG: aminotransferase class I/II-fold pyridoxal phosphate-dependent enzyme [Erysipelotrichaceae bacterium]
MNFDVLFDRTNTNCWKWDAEGKGTKYPMGTADLDFRIATPIKEALFNKINEDALTYIADYDSPKKHFCEYHNRHYGVNLNSSYVCFTNGTMVALKNMIEAYTNVGDKIIVQPPVFNYFKPTAENIGRKVVNNEMIYDRAKGTYNFNFDELEQLCKDESTKLLVICNPINPISRAIRKEELIKIMDICLKNNVIVISDEIHSDFYFNELKHISVFSLDEKYRNNAVMFTGTGKTFNLHGLYTCFVVIENELLRNKYLDVYNKSRMDAIDLGLVAASAAYTQCDDYVSELQCYISENADIITNFFSVNNLRIKLVKIEATYLAFLDLKDWYLTSEDLDKLFREYSLVLSKGNVFSEYTDGFMRIDFATQKSKLIEALNIIKTVFEERIK